METGGCAERLGQLETGFEQLETDRGLALAARAVLWKNSCHFQFGSHKSETRSRNKTVHKSAVLVFGLRLELKITRSMGGGWSWPLQLDRYLARGQSSGTRKKLRQSPACAWPIELVTLLITLWGFTAALVLGAASATRSRRYGPHPRTMDPRFWPRRRPQQDVSSITGRSTSRSLGFALARPSQVAAVKTPEHSGRDPLPTINQSHPLCVSPTTHSVSAAFPHRPFASSGESLKDGKIEVEAGIDFYERSSLLSLTRHNVGREPKYPREVDCSRSWRPVGGQPKLSDQLRPILAHSVAFYFHTVVPYNSVFSWPILHPGTLNRWNAGEIVIWLLTKQITLAMITSHLSDDLNCGGLVTA